MLSAIRAGEVAMLVEKGRWRLSMGVAEWIARSRELPFVRFVPVDATIAIRSVELQGLHPDLADRMLVATALELGVPLVTKDEKLRRYDAVETIW